MYRFALEMYTKLGNGRYDFMAQVFPMPSASRVAEFCSHGGGSPDGILWENLESLSEEIRQECGDDILDDDIRRLFFLAFDSTKIVDGIAMNPHTNEIVGVAYDKTIGFDAFDAVVSRMENVVAEGTTSDDEYLDEETEKMDKSASHLKERPEMAKNYMVFIIQSTAASHSKFKTTVARYGLHSVNAEFLTREIKQITAAMYLYNMTVVQVGCDGAPENRSALHQLATLSVRDMIELGVFPEEWLKLANVPLDFRVAYRHPSYPESDNVFVWIHTDMPHWIKKWLNAMECSSSKDSKRSLCFQGQPLTLKMCEDIWRRSVCSQGAICTSRLGDDSFIKNAASRMQFYLAARVTSQSMVQLILKYCHDENERTMYQPLVKILLLLDRMIDIINAKAVKRFEHLGGPSTPGYVAHLLKTVQTFTEWHSKAAEANHFIPESLYEDLCWVCFSVIGLCMAHIGPSCVHPTRRLAQDRLGSDVVEARFCACKARNANTKESMDWAMARADTCDQARVFNMKDKSNACKRDIETADITRPLVKPRIQKRRES